MECINQIAITLLLKTCQWLPSIIRIKSKLFTLASKVHVIWPLPPSPISSLAIFPSPTMLLILWSFHPSNTPHSWLCPLCPGSYSHRVLYVASFHSGFNLNVRTSLPNPDKQHLSVPLYLALATVCSYLYFICVSPLLELMLHEYRYFVLVIDASLAHINSVRNIVPAN